MEIDIFATDCPMKKQAYRSCAPEAYYNPLLCFIIGNLLQQS